jgi:glycosyltransferase involved in cell wall biosynthesis
MVGHLRDEKDPLTFIRAAALVSSPKARMIHIGGALDAALGEAASAAQAANPRYRWLGNLAHAATRQRLKRSHAMVIASRMEGGANVIIEAVTSGVPVLASDINGNRGMLGDDYEGYFVPGDAPALARLIDRSIADIGFYRRLCEQCAARAALFSPQTEQAALLGLVDNLIDTHTDTRNGTTHEHS